MHERGRQEGSDCDGDIDQDALERLESMQRQRIMEMFGYDAEEENAMLRAKKEERAPQVDLRAKKKARVQKPTSLPSEPRDQPVRSELPRFDGKGTRPVRHQTASEQTALKPKTSENFMSSKVSKVHGGEEKSSGVIRGRKLRKETGDEDFISTARIVEELGASMFAGRKRRAWEEKKLKAMGAKGPKKQKVPYDILMRRNKKIACVAAASLGLPDMAQETGGAGGEAGSRVRHEAQGRQEEAQGQDRPLPQLRRRLERPAAADQTWEREGEIAREVRLSTLLTRLHCSPARRAPRSCGCPPPTAACRRSDPLPGGCAALPPRST
eukprot:747926-Hanusia_phi.AAC.1